MKQGDIIIVSGVSFLAKSIKFFQRIYMKREHIESKAVFNHAGVIVIRDGCFSVAEMIPKHGIIGLFVQPYAKTYEGKRNHIILTPRIPFTPEQIQAIDDRLQEYQDRSVRYGFFDIVRQIPYSIIGWWSKKRRNDNRIICTELVANLINAAIPKAFPHPESTNPTEVWTNKHFKVDHDFTYNWRTQK
jgi:hypothetical protein